MTIVTVTIPQGTAFDDTVPTAIAMGDTAATGSAVTASRRDHLHDVFSVASQSEMEAATTSTVPVVPAVVRYAAGVAKLWVAIAANGTIGSPSYNVASITDSGTGDRTVIIDTDFSSTVYSVLVADDGVVFTRYENRGVGSFNVRIVGSDASTPQDADNGVAAFGDQ